MSHILPVTTMKPASLCQICQCGNIHVWEKQTEQNSKLNSLHKELLQKVCEQRRKSDQRSCRWGGSEELTCAEVCTYEISSRMRSDKRMRSCQTQWHGRRHDMTGRDGMGRVERGMEGRRTTNQPNWEGDTMAGWGNVCVLAVATCFDKWARGSVTLSLAKPGDGNDHFMKCNNPSGTRDEN